MIFIIILKSFAFSLISSGVYSEFSKSSVQWQFECRTGFPSWWREVTKERLPFGSWGQEVTGKDPEGIWGGGRVMSYES